MAPRSRAGDRATPVLAAASAFALAAIAGCTGLEPAAISAGASAAQSGVTFFDRGRAQTFELAEMQSVNEAVRRAGEMLGLRLVSEGRDQGPAGEPLTDDPWATPTRRDADGRPDPEDETRRRFEFRDERGEVISVLVQRRTVRTTMIETDVGVIGEKGLGSLFMRQVFAELSKMDAYLDTWDRTDPRGGGAGVPGN